MLTLSFVEFARSRFQSLPCWQICGNPAPISVSCLTWQLVRTVRTASIREADTIIISRMKCRRCFASSFRTFRLRRHFPIGSLKKISGF